MSWVAERGMVPGVTGFRWAIVAGILLFAGAVAAETVYVDDQLRVGVRSKAASSEAPLTVVTTGATLEVLDHSSGYLKVRTEEGVEGWVNSVYVTADPPARLRVEGLEANNAALQAELESVRETTSDALESNERLRRQVSELRRENGALHAQLSRLYAEAAEEEDEHDWLIYAGVLIALFLFGIFLGIRWHRQRVSARLGGLEI